MHNQLKWLPSQLSHSSIWIEQSIGKFENIGKFEKKNKRLQIFDVLNTIFLCFVCFGAQRKNVFLDTLYISWKKRSFVLSYIKKKIMGKTSNRLGWYDARWQLRFCLVQDGLHCVSLVRIQGSPILNIKSQFYFSFSIWKAELLTVLCRWHQMFSLVTLKQWKPQNTIL